MKVVTQAVQVLGNIDRFHSELKHSPELVDRLGYVHAWYADTRNSKRTRFGFSKFLGYQNLSAESYLRDYKMLDGRNTEWVLKDFFEELRPGSPDFKRYHEELTEWLGSMGRTPRSKVRLMVLKPEYREEVRSVDRRLLDLMAAVADMLPLDQRHQLRAML